jgi:flagellar biosynthesis protein FlhF
VRVKRFVASNLQEAMLKVKVDMGKDAVILHTRKFKEGGFLGFFGKSMVEVTAAIEDAPSQPVLKAPIPSRRAEKEVQPTINNFVHNLGTPNVIKPNLEQPNLVQANFERFDNFKLEKVKSEEKKETKADTNELIALQEELQAMKEMVSKVVDHIETPQDIKDLPKLLQRAYQVLSESEIEDKIIKRIIKKVLDESSPSDLNDKEKLKENIREQLIKILKNPKPITFNQKSKKQQIVAFVGPTGVGKTTTIAKLAATFLLVNKVKVALITADTYRIAAVEQLKTFAEIIGITVDVVYTPQELKTAIENHQDKDLILIDTAGRSHKNVMQMHELKSFIEIAEPTETFLVLSSTIKYKDMTDILSSYTNIALSRLIFTKLDETSTYGAIVNIINKTRKTLSYITTGQNVPDDIEVADPNNIANMVIREF